MKIQFERILIGCILASLVLSGCQEKETTAKLYNQAKAGSDKAQFKLGSCFVYGKCGLPKDYQKGRIWLSRSANRGNAYAQYLLYKLYSLKIHPDELQKVDEDKGCSALKRLDPDNQCKYNGLDKIYDIKKARYWLVPAAKQGNRLAQTMVSWEVLFNDRGNKEDAPLASRKDALQHLEKNAAKGEANAQCLLFYAYQADNLPFWPEMHRLGMVDTRKASQSLYALISNPRKNEIEDFLLPTLGVPGRNSFYQCISSGITFVDDYDLEMDGGLTKHQARMTIDGLFKAFAEESEHLPVSDRSNGAQDALTLGTMYYEGKLVPQDYRKALALFIKAAEWGEKYTAPQYISEMYSKGQGVKANPKKAKEWEQKVEPISLGADDASIDAQIEKEFSAKGQ